MCGIAGLWSAPGAAPPRADEIDAMVRALHHRGPDGHGAHLDGPIGLGHARLSIIDLAGGAQPLANEDDTVWVSFNGEIFNYVELRADLLRRGHRFRTQSDTEVLVHLYEEHGDAFVEHLNGQFAIALWDSRQRRLVLARDRVGIRPLFYADIGGRLAFASEIKALFTLPALPRRFDAAGLAASFSYWAPLGEDTVFAGVRQLPPGHVMSISASGRRLSRYWDWPFDAAPRPARDDRELEAELRALLADAVRLQLRADVPVGAYLSGGLDSSIITTLIAGHDDVRLRSFSLTFEDAEFDESAHQRELVARLRTDHSSVQATRADIARQFARTVWHAEVPLVRTAPTPMMVLADSVRAAGHKVVLTGEGADEAFGGYDLFKEAALRRFVARGGTSSARSALLGRLYPYLAHSPTAARQVVRRILWQRARARRRTGLRACDAAGDHPAHDAVLPARLARPTGRLGCRRRAATRAAARLRALAAARARPIRRGKDTDVGLFAGCAGRPHGNGGVDRSTFPVPRPPRDRVLLPPAAAAQAAWLAREGAAQACLLRPAAARHRRAQQAALSSAGQRLLLH